MYKAGGCTGLDLTSLQAPIRTPIVAFRNYYTPLFVLHVNARKKNVQLFTHTPINTRRNFYVVPSCCMRRTRKCVTTSESDQVRVCKRQMSCRQMPSNIVSGFYVMNLNNEKSDLETSKPSTGVGGDCYFFNNRRQRLSKVFASGTAPI